MRAVFLALLVSGLGSCRCVVPLHRAMNDLAEAGYRSWSVDDDVSLLSPWSEESTRDLRSVTAETLRAIEAEFGTQLPRPLHLVLMPVAGNGPEDSGAPTIHGVEAYAVPSKNTVVVLVASEAVLGADVEKLYRTVRHEMAHLTAGRLGVGGKTWFREGLALEVEYAKVHRGRLVSPPEPEPLQMARRIHQDVALARVLQWAENGSAILEGKEEAFWMGRPLAFSLFRFLLVRLGSSFGEGGEFQRGLLEILRLNEADILALEQEWHDWLERGSTQSGLGG